MIKLKVRRTKTQMNIIITVTIILILQLIYIVSSILFKTEDNESGNKGSLFGRLTGSILMAFGFTWRLPGNRSQQARDYFQAACCPL
ncbi:hypothetical protein YC2023_102935 [Brassica napus]